jgi:hypothetical protein
MFPRSNRWEKQPNLVTPGPGDYNTLEIAPSGVGIAAVQSRSERFADPVLEVPGVGQYGTRP